MYMNEKRRLSVSTDVFFDIGSLIYLLATVSAVSATAVESQQLETVSSTISISCSLSTAFIVPLFALPAQDASANAEQTAARVKIFFILF